MTVEKFVKPGDVGAWGLAVNPNLNQVYVTFRGSGTLVTLEATFGWDPRPGATFQPCGSSPDAAPFGLAFNQNTGQAVPGVRARGRRQHGRRLPHHAL